MRKVTIYYRDGLDHYREEYIAGPYPGNKAKEMMELLTQMGCRDFRVEPVKRVA
jgi:hypothetical protein